MRNCAPMGLWVPNSSRLTVSPIRHTAAPARSSSSENTRPSSSVQLPVISQALLLPMMLLIPAVLLYVGSRGRTFKEAQANVSVLLFVVSLVPAVQLFLQQKEPDWLVLVPVSGQYTLLKLALRGEAIPVSQLALSYVVPALLIVVALVAVARLLGREANFASR